MKHDPKHELCEKADYVGMNRDRKTQGADSGLQAGVSPYLLLSPRAG